MKNRYEEMVLIETTLLSLRSVRMNGRSGCQPYRIRSDPRPNRRYQPIGLGLALANQQPLNTLLVLGYRRGRARR